MVRIFFKIEPIKSSVDVFCVRPEFLDNATVKKFSCLHARTTPRVKDISTCVFKKLFFLLKINIFLYFRLFYFVDLKNNF